MFIKGQSGNPGGRPRATAELRDLAQTAGIEAFQRVVELTRHEDPKVALEAVKIVLDRGFGRPAQPVDGDGVGGPIVLQVLTGVPRSIGWGSDAPSMVGDSACS